jgi:hypothetical protein
MRLHERDALAGILAAVDIGDVGNVDQRDARCLRQEGGQRLVIAAGEGVRAERECRFAASWGTLGSEKSGEEQDAQAEPAIGEELNVAGGAGAQALAQSERRGAEPEP